MRGGGSLRHGLGWLRRLWLVFLFDLLPWLTLLSGVGDRRTDRLFTRRVSAPLFVADGVRLYHASPFLLRTLPRPASLLRNVSGAVKAQLLALFALIRLASINIAAGAVVEQA